MLKSKLVGKNQFLVGESEVGSDTLSQREVSAGWLPSDLVPRPKGEARNGGAIRGHLRARVEDDGEDWLQDQEASSKTRNKLWWWQGSPALHAKLQGVALVKGALNKLRHGSSAVEVPSASALSTIPSMSARPDVDFRL